MKYTFILNKLTSEDRMTYEFYKKGQSFAHDVIADDLDSAAEIFGLGYDDVVESAE
jgi:hypothetical protein